MHQPCITQRITSHKIANIYQLVSNKLRKCLEREDREEACYSWETTCGKVDHPQQPWETNYGNNKDYLR